MNPLKNNHEKTQMLSKFTSHIHLRKIDKSIPIPTFKRNHLPDTTSASFGPQVTNPHTISLTDVSVSPFFVKFRYFSIENTFNATKIKSECDFFCKMTTLFVCFY